MGIPPSEVLAMSLHDYQAAIHHWSKGSEEEAETLSGDDFDEMMIAMASMEVH